MLTYKWPSLPLYVHSFDLHLDISTQIASGLYPDYMYNCLVITLTLTHRLCLKIESFTFQFRREDRSGRVFIPFGMKFPIYNMSSFVCSWEFVDGSDLNHPIRGNVKSILKRPCFHVSSLSDDVKHKLSLIQQCLPTPTPYKKVLPKARQANVGMIELGSGLMQTKLVISHTQLLLQSLRSREDEERA